MKKTGLGDSPFFPANETKPPATPPPDDPPVDKEQNDDNPTAGKRPTAETPANHGTTTPRDHDTTTPRYHDTMIESIRKSVKEFGKEAATHRFTKDEKKAIADIIYAFRHQGVRTSENEIARIAINFVINDYRRDPKSSVLGRALRALNE